MLRLYYHLSNYISHKRAGEDYIAALQRVGVTITDDPAQADVLLLHDDPLALADIIPRYTGKYIIAYCVWETSQLPREYRESLRGVQRIWTCSPFSAAAFTQAGFVVDVVPHIVSQEKPSVTACDFIKEYITYDNNNYYFYTIVDSVNPRKNLDAILRLFVSVFAKNERVKLVVKQYRKSWDIASIPNIISIDSLLSREQIAAMHTIFDCYISAHHAEAWGLSLSDAMSCGKPVIATGYSGNMFYMDDKNSFPVNFQLMPVSEKMCSLIPLYTREMQWAEIDEKHFEYLMRKVYNKKYNEDLLIKAREAMRQFESYTIGLHMKRLLNSI